MSQASHMIFELVEGNAVPKLARALDGTLRTADGVRYFTLEQAAAKSGISEATLRAIFRATFGELLPSEAEPIVAAAGADEPPAAGDVKRSILHRMVYPEFSEEEFELFMEDCRQRGLNPWCKHVCAERRYDSVRHRFVVEIITTINGFRAIADRTGLVTGHVGPMWAGPDLDWMEVWRGEDAPFAAKFGVRRVGQEEPVWATAKWKTYAPFVEVNGRIELALHWQRMPDLMLGKVAEALALRRAFPEQLGGLYTSDEMGQARNPQPDQSLRGARPTQLADARPNAIVVDESTPHTLRELELELVDFGFKTPDARQQLLRTIRQAVGNVYQDRVFYAAVLQELRLNPERYGAKLPELAV